MKAHFKGSNRVSDIFKGLGKVQCIRWIREYRLDQELLYTVLKRNVREDTVPNVVPSHRYG